MNEQKGWKGVENVGDTIKLVEAHVVITARSSQWRNIHYLCAVTTLSRCKQNNDQGVTTRGPSLGFPTETLSINHFAVKATGEKLSIFG